MLRYNIATVTAIIQLCIFVFRFCSLIKISTKSEIKSSVLGLLSSLSPAIISETDIPSAPANGSISDISGNPFAVSHLETVAFDTPILSASCFGVRPFSFLICAMSIPVFSLFIIMPLLFSFIIDNDFYIIQSTLRKIALLCVKPESVRSCERCKSGACSRADTFVCRQIGICHSHR